MDALEQLRRLHLEQADLNAERDAAAEAAKPRYEAMREHEAALSALRYALRDPDDIQHYGDPKVVAEAIERLAVALSNTGWLPEHLGIAAASARRDLADYRENPRSRGGHPGVLSVEEMHLRGIIEVLVVLRAALETPGAAASLTPEMKADYFPGNYAHGCGTILHRVANELAKPNRPTGACDQGNERPSEDTSKNVLDEPISEGIEQYTFALGSKGWSRFLSKTDAGRLLGGTGSDRSCRDHLDTLVAGQLDVIRSHNKVKHQFCLAWVESIEPTAVKHFSFDGSGES